MHKIDSDVAKKQGMPELPSGWHYELSDHDQNVAYIIWPDHGAVSVNFKHRTFRTGWCTPGPARDGVAPKQGKGWRSLLVAEAVEALKAAWE